MKETNIDEKWKDVSGYEGLYQISSLGRIKSFNLNKETILNTGNCLSYQNIVLCKDKVRTTKRIHRLVAEAFILNTENKPQVNHINGFKSDNNVLNLEWVTASENNLHKRDVLGYKHSNITKAKISKNNKNSRKVFCSITGKQWISVKECSLELGYDHIKLIAKLSGNLRNNTTLKFLS
jgi:hypothetical protein